MCEVEADFFFFFNPFICFISCLMVSVFLHMQNLLAVLWLLMLFAALFCIKTQSGFRREVGWGWGSFW